MNGLNNDGPNMLLKEVILMNQDEAHNTKNNGMDHLKSLHVNVTTVDMDDGSQIKQGVLE